MILDTDNPTSMQLEAEASQTTILLVDDDAAIREGVTDLLTYYRYRVVTMNDGAEAVRWMQDNTPDLVISDIMMYQMDGYQFFEVVRSNPAWTTIPFIFLTARGQQNDIRRGHSLGADHYVTKPFEPEDLLIAVRSRLKRVRDIQSSTQRDVDRMKHQLMTIFSHELRTPLTYIYGYVSLLQDGRDKVSESEVSDMLNEIQRGADRLIKLVEDLLLMVRIDSGFVELEVAHRRMHANLNLMIHEVVRDLNPRAEARGVEVSINIPRNLVLLCVSSYLQDALARVLDNAIKFSKGPGSRVWISAQAENGQVTITIEDEGIGIPPDQLKQIYERFRQIDREKLEQQGIGLGLTIARSLITFHGGTIEVNSRPGEGTIVRVLMPLDADGPSDYVASVEP